MTPPANTLFLAAPSDFILKYALLDIVLASDDAIMNLCLTLELTASLDDSYYR
jgi:hypothetical protein